MSRYRTDTSGAEEHGYISIVEVEYVILEILLNRGGPCLGLYSPGGSGRTCSRGIEIEAVICRVLLY